MKWVIQEANKNEGCEETKEAEISWEHIKRERVAEHHCQKPRCLVTLDEFLPRWLCIETAQVNIEACYLNTGKEEMKGESPLVEPPSSENPIISLC